MIPVNKPYLPLFGKYTHYLERMYKNGWLTNNGPLCKELKIRLEDYLGVKNLLLVSNGTLAMQIAYKALNVNGNAITTPFTFIATTSSLDWEGISPKFADIDNKSLNLCRRNVELLIDSRTTAVIPVHVYGNPCNVYELDDLSKKYNLKLIYDAAHAFGVKINNKSVLSFGDASTLSFHATKVFHTVEGGAVVFKSSDAYEEGLLYTNFGIDTQTQSIKGPGINTKMSEAHAAMGLAVLDDIDKILERRVNLFLEYKKLLGDIIEYPLWNSEASLNGSYMPVVVHNSEECNKVFNKLQAEGIMARKYFSPSLNLIPHYSSKSIYACVNSESYASRTLCLPLYYDLTSSEVSIVVESIKSALI